MLMTPGIPVIPAPEPESSQAEKFLDSGSVIPDLIRARNDGVSLFNSFNNSFKPALAEAGVDANALPNWVNRFNSGLRFNRLSSKW